MLSQKEVSVLNQLRRNSRCKLTDLAQHLEIPVTTLYGRLRSWEKKLIRKHTCLIDFSRLGYGKSVYFVLKAKERKAELRDFLHAHHQVNSLLRINYGFDFLLEGIFRDEKEATLFMEELEDRFHPEIQMLNVIEELKREEFMLPMQAESQINAGIARESDGQ